MLVMGKVKINKEDKTRVLLTELLPYEVPMLFSNEGFYNIIRNGNFEYFNNKIKNNWQRQYALSFNYDIKKNIIGDTRTLSIIHPFVQHRYIELFEKYDSLILHLCSKSPFSLRKINKIAKFYFSPNFVFEEENIANPDREVEPDILDAESQYIKSYYTYKPIDLIYKFYDRNEFQRLEQRYNYLMEFDISKCFYHIYTHSITWAVKDKESAKLNSSNNIITFENTFDKLMQHSNYNETNGIVVGPEISRIFAEIILQQVDLNVLEKLSNKNIGLKFGVDYDVRRYVDDYFVFSNDSATLEMVKRTFQKELQFYKLYLNPQKDDIKVSPFISDIAVGKLEVKEYLIEFYDSFFEENMIEEKAVKQIKQINKPYVVSQSFIKKFQSIVKRNNLTYDSLSKDVVRFFKSKIVDLLKNDVKLYNIERSESFLLMLIDIVSYCYSVNINTNTTFRIAQIIVLLVKHFESKSRPDIKHSIYSKIFKDCEFILTNFHRKQVKNETSIETINLLLAIKKLGNEYQFSPEKISDYFNLEDDKLKNLNYFHFITLLYYFNDDLTYHSIKGKLIEEIVNRFNVDFVFLKSELTLLFFDIINCPFIDEKHKIKIIKASKYIPSKNPSNDEVRLEIEKIMEQKKWFMNWEIDIDLERVLKKKEWSSSY